METGNVARTLREMVIQDEIDRGPSGATGPRWRHRGVVPDGMLPESFVPEAA